MKSWWFAGADDSIADMMVCPCVKGALGFREEPTGDRLPPFKSARDRISCIVARRAAPAALHNVKKVAERSEVS